MSPVTPRTVSGRVADAASRGGTRGSPLASCGWAAIRVICLVMMAWMPIASAAAAGPPGVVIDHVPAATGTYVGSPSLAILPDGRYVACHDLFGPASSEWRGAVTRVFQSGDRGATWTQVATVEPAFWSGLFVHREELYLMGTTHHHGRIVIRRSRDGGKTWSVPDSAATGLLTETGEYHTAPMPVLVHGGRLWRAFEDAGGGTEWGKRYGAMMLSALEGDDLLDRRSWTFSNPLPRDAAWLDGRFTGWLEGNAVADAEGRVLDILRVDTPSGVERAAIVEISADGRRAAFDPATGFIEFPGGAKKFTIRRDPRSEALGERPVWWSLATAVPPIAEGRAKPASIRNTLVLLRSHDLRTWESRSIVLHHPDVAKHAFQYVDWVFDGDDLVAVSRTAHDDDAGGAHRAHDANYLTFHRLENFRDRTWAHSVVEPASLGWQAGGRDQRSVEPVVPAAALARPRPNVLFIAADDLRTDLGCYGDPLVRTPCLDRLAARGTLFEAAYCQQAVCNPSRASLLTGRRPDSLHIWDLPTHFRTRHPELVTLPQVFKQQGYHTENIGKIYHNWRQRIEGDPASWSVPAVMHFANHAADRPEIEGPLPPDAAGAPRCEMRDVPDDAYFDGRIATRAVEAVRAAASRPEPFFLAVGFWKPHAPFNAPKRYWDLYDPASIPPPRHPEWPQDAPRIAWHDGREILREAPEGRLSAAQARTIRHGYLAATSYLDAQVGRVLEELDRLGIADRTIVVFWSDHGYHLGEHDLWAKTSNFELDARVPLIIAAPGVPGGGHVATPVELLDLYPTLVELADVSQPAGLEGESLVPLLHDHEADFKAVALTQHPRPAYFNRGEGSAPEAMGYSVRSRSHRYTEWRDWQTGQTLARELYDHAADPFESVNLAGRPAERDILDRHAALLESFRPLVRPGWAPVLP